MDLPEERQNTLFSAPIILLTVAVLLLVALLNRRSDLTLLCLLVLTLFAAACFLGRTSFRRLQWHARIARPRLFPGEEALISLEVINAKYLPVWVRARLAPFPAGALAAEGDLSGECSLLWHQRARFEWRFTVLRRGVHRPGPASITAADLFGLYPHEKPLRLPQIVVYPRIVEIAPLELPRRAMFGLPGTRSPVQDPVYLLGTRDYRSGRPARFIHWKASARHQHLQEKLFDPSEQEKVLLVLEMEGFARAEAGPALERTLEVIAAAAVQFDKRSSAFGLVCNARINGDMAHVLPVAAHRGQVSVLLELLARIEPVASMELCTILARSIKLPWGTSALVFGHSSGPALHNTVHFFGSRRVPVTLVTSETCPNGAAGFTGAQNRLLTLEQLYPAHGQRI